MPSLAAENLLKRKRTYLSSPPPEQHDLAQIGAGTETLKQAAQQELDTHADCLVYTEWSGRGRSPYKTPATAAIDGVKENARLLETLEREIILHQDQLEDLLAAKKARLCGIHQSKFSVAGAAQDTEMSLPHVPTIPLLPASTKRSRSLSPSKYLAKLANGTPSIIHCRVEKAKQNDIQIPVSVKETMKLLQHGLEIGCIPRQFKVGGYACDLDTFNSLNFEQEAMQELQPEIDFDLYANGLAFGDFEEYSQERISLLWQMARTVSDEACSCEEGGCDENGWNFRVVYPALQWEVPAVQGHAHKEIPFSRTEPM